MSRKLVLFALVATLLFATSASAQWPMPYCPCVTLEYCPAGPATPTNFMGPPVSGIYSDINAFVKDVAEDIGQVPYSVPNFGWHCKESEQLLSASADVFAMTYAINIQFNELHCCGYTIVPDDPLFVDGVTLTWDEGLGSYRGDIGNHTYIAVADHYPSGGFFWVRLYEGVYNENGIMVFYVGYLVAIPEAGDGLNRPPRTAAVD